MRQYVIYSSIGHALFMLFFLIKFATNTNVKNKTYFIDFISATPQIETPQNKTGIEKTESAVIGKQETKTKSISNTDKDDYFDKDDFSSNELKPSMASLESKILKETASSTLSDSSSEPSSSSINTDSNFPYPWYITQLREALWDSWQKIMPVNASLKCIISFRINSNGSITKVEVEKSSGNRMFDQSAISAVENADRLPPLPESFFEDYLTVHVEFKNKGG